MSNNKFGSIDIPTRTKRRIAIVENSQELIFYSRILNLRGYEIVHVATSMQEVINSLEEGKLAYIDYIMIDYSKDGLDGLAIAAEVVKREPGIKIIILSRDESMRNESLAAGFGFIPKPFTIGELMDGLRR